MLGPFRGGRVDAVSGVPGRPHEFYFGSVNGGVWKTVNAGRTWMPVFDSQPVASIGAIAVAPSSPDVVYVGSGESSLRDSVGYGNGVYKSTDAGKTWTHIGLADTQHIGKVAVDPRNANTVFVAAIGHFYGPHPDRGVYRSKDGGSTWQKVLYKNDSVGAIDVAIDPVNSQIVYASLWNTRRPPWYVYGPSNGPGGGIFKSTDGGTTWNQLTNGLPAEGVGRSGLAISPSNPKIVYAVIDAKEGGLFRSNDAGATWTKTTGDTRVWGRGWYFEKVAVDPKNPDVVYVPNVGIQRSTDGGKTFSTWAMRGSPGGDDYQGVWVYPGDGNILIAASDQGAIITLGATRGNAAVELVAESADGADLSRVGRLSLSVLGNRRAAGQRRRRRAHARQVRRDIDARLGADLRRRRERHHGSRSAAAGHPLRRHRRAVRSGSQRQRGEHAAACGPDGPRRDWTQPLIFSRADPRVLYYADQYLYRTTSGSTTWTRISDDLTRPDPGIPQTLDAAAAALTDRNGKRGVIYTIAPSPVLGPMVWIGTDDGLIQMTMNDGKTWQNVTPPPLTAWSRVTTVEASHSDFNEAYASVDRHQLEDFDPYIYRTRDSGKTWQKITNGLPAGVYAHVVKEDPRRRGLLFAGTERGIYVSFNDGDAWQPLQLNLPVTSVRDIEIHGDDLIAATHGRGFWVIDDIASMRQLDDAGRGRRVPLRACRDDLGDRRAATMARHCRRTSRRQRTRRWARTSTIT